MAGNMQISIYHIDKRSVEEEMKNRDIDTDGNIEDKTYSTEDMVNFLLDENKDYIVQTLREDSEIDLKGYQTKVAYKPSFPKPTIWREFFLEILDKNSRMLESKKQEESFMVFLYNDNNIYSITGGFAFHRIESYLDSLFGIKILSGLIDKNSKKIKGVSERSVSKSVMATTKMFRVDYSISEDEEFGKIYKEIIAQLDSKILEEKLGFKKNEIKKVQCIARTYFKITKSINIQEVYKFIDKIDKIMNQDIDNLNFEFAYFDNIDDALIDGRSQNQEFFDLLLKNEKIRNDILGIFLNEIYKSLRNEEMQGLNYDIESDKTLDGKVAEDSENYKYE